MIQKSKRHKYYATEKYEMMKAIASTNREAAEIVAEADKARELKKRRMFLKEGKKSGESGKK